MNDDSMLTDKTQPDYVQIATPLVERGFRVTPVHPETKSGVMLNWQNHQATTPDEVQKHAKYYPHHNVGVVGKRGVGRHMFLDIDAEGVVERIEEESGRKMPQTYTVCSRPKSATYKRHLYFTQTPYSFKRFGSWNGKNINVRDLTRLERSRSGMLMHPTLYDIKGVGGGSLVVGAGSVRDNGEVYACIDDSPVVPIPEWLVDWLLADFQKYRVGRDKELAEKHEAKVIALRMSEAGRRELRQQNLPDGFDIAEEDIYDFLRWRASSYSGLGETGEKLAQSLTYQVTRFCAGGKAFAESEAGLRVIQKIANEERNVGNATWFYRQRAVKVGDIHHIPSPPPTKISVIREVMAGFPGRISAASALELIEAGLEKEGFPFDRRRDKDKLSGARKALGFTVEHDGLWKRASDAPKVEV
ncbi:MAG TPA: bifunctional DNA primase/polymerase [Candidatus Sulfotelmatobacter sp.]|nr:bifunctional DNA primase/polymerase [Candidatus Sulfotelmatobacter sp.]